MTGMKRIILILFVCSLCFADIFTSDIKPKTTNSLNVGSADYYWKNGYFVGSVYGTWNGEKVDISDYTNLSATAPIVLTGDILSMPEAGAAINGYLSSTDWSDFYVAYTHSQDNTQAHSDYLINNGDDITTGALTAANFVSNTAIGTQPYACTSTTLNANLNADLWDGYEFANYLNQAVKTASSPTFADLTLSAPSSIYSLNHNSFVNGAGNQHIDWTAASQDFYTTGTGRFDGNVGVGTAPSSSSILNISKSISVGATRGIYGGIINSFGTGVVVLCRGLDFQASWQPADLTANRNCNSLQGVLAIADAKMPTLVPAEDKNMTIVNAMGIVAGVTADKSTGTGTLNFTNAGCFVALNAILLNGATITTLSAFSDPGMTAGTTNWGLAINTQSYINANLSIGKNTAPTVALDVVGSASVTGNTTLGDASTDLITCTGRLILRDVAADPTVVATAGNRGEIVYSSTTEKVYLKTIDTGTNTNWSALN